MARTPPVKEGFRAGGSKYHPASQAAAALLIKQIGPEVKAVRTSMPRAEDKAARRLQNSALNKSRISDVK